MSRRNGKLAVVLALFLIIITAFVIYGWSMYIYMDKSWRLYVIAALSIAMLIYIIAEFVGFSRYFRVIGKHRQRNRDIAETLVLLNEAGTGITTWDLRNKTGLIIGRSGDTEVDVDLSGTEYFPVISSLHAALNYADGCWYLSDVGSKNGTELLRGGAENRLLLAPGEAVSIRPGDTIYIAQEVALAVK